MFERNVSLKNYVHWKIGGEADYFCAPKTINELKDALREAQEKKIPVFILGSGTNLLVSDNGFRGVVIQPKLDRITQDGSVVTAEAGALISAVLQFAHEHGLSGLEWAGGLPGTLGGAIRGNAGAFGGEMKDSVESVESINVNDPSLTLKRWTRSECAFGYRTSVFKEKEGDLIVRAMLRFTPGEKTEIWRVLESRMNYRKEKHPIEYPNAGSVFKNTPVAMFAPDILAKLQGVIKTDPLPVVPSAYLISEAGLKGVKVGGAQISEKHPNFIVNLGGATAKDVEQLIALVKVKVKEKFGILLEEEVMRIG